MFKYLGSNIVRDSEQIKLVQPTDSRLVRFGIGQKIEQGFLDILELTFAAAYLPPEQKILTLGKAISSLDSIKFFAQIAWENKLIPDEKYIILSQKLNEVGRMLGGWKKGLQNKLPPNK